MKTISKVDAKGRITLSKDLRIILKLEQGDRIEVEHIPRSKKAVMRKVK